MHFFAICEIHDIKIMPSSITKERVMPMSTSEVLTLLLVVFAALSYIDNHNNKKK